MRWMIGLAVVAGQLAAKPAAACSLIPTVRHERDPAHTGDTTAPTSTTITSVDVSRSGGGCGGGDTCGSIAAIAIDVESIDDRTPAGSFGYRLRVVGGTPPSGLGLADFDIRPLDSIVLYF